MKRSISVGFWALFIFGIYALYTGVIGTLVGSFVGPHILFPALGHLIAGAAAMYFVCRWASIKPS